MLALEALRITAPRAGRARQAQLPSESRCVFSGRRAGDATTSAFLAPLKGCSSLKAVGSRVRAGAVRHVLTVTASASKPLKDAEMKQLTCAASGSRDQCRLTAVVVGAHANSLSPPPCGPTAGPALRHCYLPSRVCTRYMTRRARCSMWASRERCGPNGGLGSRRVDRQTGREDHLGECFHAVHMWRLTLQSYNFSAP